MTTVETTMFVGAMDRPRVKRRFPRPIWVGVALSAALTAGVAWFALHSGERALRLPISRITVSSVTTAPFQDFIPVRGRVEPLASVVLDAVQGGRVEEVLAEAGQKVVAGQPLIRLSEPSLELEAIARETQIIEQINNQRSLELNFEQTRSTDAKAVADADYNITRLERQVARRRPLAAKGFGSQEQLDQSADELAYQEGLRKLAADALQRDAAVIARGKDLLQRTASRLDANLAAAKSQLDALIVRAPTDGLLTGLDAHVGEEKTRGGSILRRDRSRRWLQGYDPSRRISSGARQARPTRRGDDRRLDQRVGGRQGLSAGQGRPVRGRSGLRRRPARRAAARTGGSRQASSLGGDAPPAALHAPPGRFWRLPGRRVGLPCSIATGPAPRAARGQARPAQRRLGRGPERARARRSASSPPTMPGSIASTGSTFPIETGELVMIHLVDVTKSYQTSEVETLALRQISLDIRQGEFLAVMGPSGCGKSTLLNLLGLLDTPTDGRFLFLGEEISHASERKLTLLRRAHVGFVFQSFNLIDDLTVEENVEVALLYRGVGSAERTRRSAAALERVGLKHRARHLPKQLSGGQQQRVAVARALVAAPKLILADEPTGNLDTANGDAVLAMLGEVASEGATVVMVTHSRDHASRASRVIDLLDGQIAPATRIAA